MTTWSRLVAYFAASYEPTNWWQDWKMTPVKLQLVCWSLCQREFSAFSYRHTTKKPILQYNTSWEEQANDVRILSIGCCFSPRISPVEHPMQESKPEDNTCHPPRETEQWAAVELNWTEFPLWLRICSLKMRVFPYQIDAIQRTRERIRTVNDRQHPRKSEFTQKYLKNYT